MRTYLTNCRVFTGETLYDGLSVEIEDGRVVGLIAECGMAGGVEVVDLGGNLLAPGFIDVQVNGGGGVLFNECHETHDLKIILEAHRRYGTTSLIPTLISDRWDVMVSAAGVIRQGLRLGVPGLLGVHFEGPYINPERKGIHQEAFIRPVDDGAFELFSAGDLGVVMTTVAPELVPPDFIRSLSDAGVRVCLGHTAATYDQVRAGIAAGAIGVTHLFNAMSPLTSREPGVVGAALDDAETWVGVIADGHHIHFASLRIACAVKEQGKVMLVTDAMPSVGASEKNFTLQGHPILAEDGRCQSVGGTLAGSDLNMADAVRNAVEKLHFSEEEALRMASLYPATFLGVDDRLGRIAVGYQADFVVMDAEFHVLDTWIAGDNSF
ncbi:N-acetylglucosamine-6-phosphate deacetylase [Pseudodesulfovibrio sp. JC047]|uniref:N-acetylglucosamine-6-phosphate deacetylase n=1 Tax=Pseudodesulfovibrio sp. JC047 TaxID=2683199 RepID=UPI0013D8592E|nr:N-acetylglucosamine-6-phosphate deacetylase [Pseudodesulfovibrio sp. JC047]NDV18693.1 N-acetylglucosamine-6-phosphate deacetylase [Pseudodesulfovibrio sp. JC047]